MTLDSFLKALENPESEAHSAMLSHIRGLLKESMDEMSKKYSLWDSLDAAFRSERTVDRDDRVAASKGQPQKMVVPLTFSQLMTFVAFNTMVVTQNKRFYELEPTGTEDNPLREPLELILERDLRRNTFQTFLQQFFLDIGRFSIGVAEVGWVEETRQIKVDITRDIPAAFGGEPTQETTSQYVPVPTFVGNRIFSISPYRFYPDTRLPLTRYQEGEFCASEDMFSYSSIAGDSSLINVDKIPKYTAEAAKARVSKSRVDLGQDFREPGVDGAVSPFRNPKDCVDHGPVVITKIVLDINPAQFHITPDEKLDPSLDFTLRFVAWVANDQVIIKWEEATYLHGQFPYILGQYIPDREHTINMSLAEVCDQLTTLVTWQINAHITAQKNSINGKYLIDPAGIDIASLEGNSPYIRLKKNASQTGVDRYIKQFTTVDTTANYMQEAAGIKSLLGEVTGYNETMNGQYSQGRRSATQDRVVAQAGSARGKSTLGSIWDTAFEPLGKQMIANNRQQLDFETFSRVVGKGPFGTSPETGMPMTVEELYSLFSSDPVAIATSEDFFVFDATIPSEKAFLAQSLQEILLTMMQNPQLAAMLGYGPNEFRSLMQDVYNLRGVTPSRLPAPTAQPPLPPALPGGPGNVAPPVAP